MRTKAPTDPDRIRPPPPPEEQKVTLPYDASNEAIVIAGVFNDEATRKGIIHRFVGDHFQQKEHRELWEAFQEADRRGLLLDLALVEHLTSAATARYLAELAELKPGAPMNLGYHVANVLWDHARITASRGPIPAFIEALRDQKAEPERVRALSKAITQCFDGYEDRKYLLDGDQLVRDQMRDAEARASGLSTWAYGVRGLDFFVSEGPKETWRKRMLPGAAPGQITVVTGVSGGGKTTLTANVVLGIAFPEWREGNFDAPGRTVTYGAWEMKGGMTLEIMAGMSLGWSRSELIDPLDATATRPASPLKTPEGRAMLREREMLLKSRIRFLANPFRRRVGEKGSNQRNADILQGYLADAGSEVFVGDLWKRCLAARESGPEDEEEALIRQQMMAEELYQHHVLIQQQRLKDIEMRPDKRPTREGIKGSSAWVEIADTIIGVHRPFLFKRVADDKLEVFVLKQRYGRWPLGIEFDWDPDTGIVSGGKPIDYDRPGESNEIDRTAGISNWLRPRK